MSCDQGIKIMSHAAQQLSTELEEWGAVPVPVGEPVSQLRGAILSEAEDGSETGVWESSPGSWQRQIVDAEMCYFLSGRCRFTPVDGEPMEINAGDMVYFPANSLGLWEILETSRKVYITYKSH